MPDEPSARSVVRKTRAAIGRQARARTTPNPLGLPDLAREIEQSLAQERLALILGAGVSAPSGFPGWSKLLEGLSRDLIPDDERAAFEMLAAFDTPLVIARYLKSRMASYAAFPSAVREALYTASVDYTKANDTLDLVVAIAGLAQARGSRLDIITYNFDDLVERRLATTLPGLPHGTVADDPQFHAPGPPIRIFHVHGFIDPVDGAQSVVPPPRLVLSEDEFHELMNDPRAWQNQVQVSAFGYRDCLFLGMSMTDPNLRRVIDFVAGQDQRSPNRRWILNRRYREGSTLASHAPPMTKAIAEQLNAIKSEMFASLGARPVTVDGYSELAAVTAAIKALY